jgi:hypothetical protein
MKEVFYFFALALALACSLPALAGDLGSDADKALKETQDMLMDPSLRREATRGNADAAKVEAQVQGLGLGAEGQKEVFGISADILGSMVQETGGDPALMQQRMNEALANPESFFNGLSADQQKRIREVSGELDPKKQAP